MSKAAITGLLLGLLGLAPDATATSYKLTYFRFPGTVETTAVDINDAGQIVGNYTDATGSHGYIGRPGALMSFDRQISGINNLGQLVGRTQNPDEFYVSTGGTIATYIVPGSNGSYGITVGDINDHGQVAGYFSDFQSTVLFVGGPGGFTTTSYPDSGSTFYGLQGIDNAGDIGGNAYDRSPNSVPKGFLGQPGALQLLPAPSASANPRFGKLSSDGVLIGVAFQSVGFLTQRPIPFQYLNGNLTLLDLGIGTLPYRGNIQLNSVNANGEVVGTLFSNGIFPTGFLATPITDVPEPASLTLLAASLLVLGARRRRKSAYPPPG